MADNPHSIRGERASKRKLPTRLLPLALAVVVVGCSEPPSRKPMAAPNAAATSASAPSAVAPTSTVEAQPAHTPTQSGAPKTRSLTEAVGVTTVTADASEPVNATTQANASSHGAEPNQGAASNGSTGDASSDAASERVKADVKATKRGRMDKADGGYLHVVVTARNYAKNALAFDQIKHAMDLWSAMHDFEKPATHEQFMEEIIQANQIQLPVLPEGHRYIYDPKLGELMVERPAESSSG